MVIREVCISLEKAGVSLSTTTSMAMHWQEYKSAQTVTQLYATTRYTTVNMAASMWYVFTHVLIILTMSYFMIVSFVSMCIFITARKTLFFREVLCSVAFLCCLIFVSNSSFFQEIFKIPQPNFQA